MNQPMRDANTTGISVTRDALEDEELSILEFPKEPYPGLRPFLAHESALLCGREDQVKEIRAHLEASQFVAVIGGSGSGKSSLVRAGLIPKLRSYGIRGAGDFWIPLICTPGTNASGAQGLRETPIRRLAWKFSQLLSPCESKTAEAARVSEIAEVFRQDAGFARLAEGYLDELKLPTGVQAKNARLLFVIDQFEEVFHPTNKDTQGRMLEDASLLVERVIHHFFAPHPRVYVVLTMRSEHLNDCAGFLELPDAINKASYLVRRLDPEQLKDAIVEPATRYLRVRIREASEPGLLPSKIVFDQHVLDRLMRDAQDIAHDPDHLPLLQHVLSHTWNVARRRSCDGRMPERIEWADLAAATLCVSPEDAVLDEKVNVLRESLERQAEALYLAHKKPEDREFIEWMLRNLAFKDPNTGLYTQQRLEVDAENAERLSGLVSDGYVGSVNYLYWDTENPERVTLKISHESFIRGWNRFRRLVDREAERFEEFLQVLRACQRWSAADETEDDLLEGAQLRRLADANLDTVFADASERERWFGFLGFTSAGARFQETGARVAEFIRRSQAREKAAIEAREAALESQRKMRLEVADMQRREAERELLVVKQREEALERQRQIQIEAAEAKRSAAEAELLVIKQREETRRQRAQIRRARYQKIGLGVAVLGLLPAVLFLFFVESPTGDRIQLSRQASSEMNAVMGGTGYSGFTPMFDSLKGALSGGELLSEAKTGTDWFQRTSVAILDHSFSVSVRGYELHVPGVQSQRENFNHFLEDYEPRIHSAMGTLLSGLPWPGAPPAPTVPAKGLTTPIKRCQLKGRNDPPNAVASGVVYEATLRQNSGAVRRAVLMSQFGTEADQQFSLRAATLADGPKEGSEPLCVAGDAFWFIPPRRTFDQQILMDGSLTFLMARTRGVVASLSVIELQWLFDANRRAWFANQVGPRNDVVLDPSGSAAVDAAAGTMAFAVVPSWVLPLGVGVRVGHQNWRLLGTGTQVASVVLENDKGWQSLVATKSSPCAPLLEAAQRDKNRATNFTGPPGKPEVSTGETNHYCIFIFRDSQSGNGITLESGKNLVSVAVYVKPEGPSPPYPAALTWLSFGAQATADKEWFIHDQTGPYSGWLALRSGNEHHYFALPWSTESLMSVGRQIYAGRPPSTVSNVAKVP